MFQHLVALACSLFYPDPQFRVLTPFLGEHVSLRNSTGRVVELEFGLGKRYAAWEICIELNVPGDTIRGCESNRLSLPLVGLAAVGPAWVNASATLRVGHEIIGRDWTVFFVHNRHHSDALICTQTGISLPLVTPIQPLAIHAFESEDTMQTLHRYCGVFYCAQLATRKAIQAAVNLLANEQLTGRGLPAVGSGSPHHIPRSPGNVPLLELGEQSDYIDILARAVTNYLYSDQNAPLEMHHGEYLREPGHTVCIFQAVRLVIGTPLLLVHLY
jgi:hypothetical protein